jgi:hypothetical protein
MINRRTRITILCAITGLSALLLVLLPRIPQPLSYHAFADARPIFGVANGFDVLSNLAFLAVGALGLFLLLSPDSRRLRVSFLASQERWAYLVFFLGVTLTSFGSAFYHLAPNNATLVWDRLPMTVAFLSFLSATIAERISVNASLRLLLPLLAFGVASVFYWQYSELHGRGDLRPYLFAQFFPMLIIPVMIFMFPPRYTRATDLLGVFAAYALAKILELLDRPIFSLGQIVSGHTLKHLAAALASFLLLRMLWLRSPIEPATSLRPME